MILKKKMLAWLLTAAMLLTILPFNALSVLAADPITNPAATGNGVVLQAFTREIDVSSETTDITISDSGFYKLSGIKDGISVIVNTTAPVTLVLDGLNLSNDVSPL